MQGIYWIVNGNITHSKVQALHWANGDISKIKFYFFDKEWENNRWDSPPKKSLQQLIRERCESLRNETNHLTLWLSSGYDSITILDNFIKYNLPIDEVCIFKRNHYDQEHPIARKIAQRYKDDHNPNVIITDMELGVNYIKNHHQQILNNDFWSMGFGIRIQSSTQAIGDNRLTGHSLIKNYSDRLAVYGFEKPRVTLHNNKWYAMFPDSASFDAINLLSRGFWLDEDCWELYHSACWNVISWFETLPNLTNNLVHQIQKNDTQYYAAWNLSIGRIPVSNAFSHSGQNKKLFTQSMMAPCNLELNKYMQQYEQKIWTNYEDNLLTLQKIVGKDVWENISDDFPVSTFTICSDSKFLRPLNLQNTLVNC